MMGIATEICFRLSKKIYQNRLEGSAGENPATFNENSYEDWRNSELNQQFTKYFKKSDVVDRDVLDFGCGKGELSFLMADFQVKSIKGIDVSEECINAAKQKLNERNTPIKPQFCISSSTTKIDLADNSIDIILCFDVLEHIMEYKKIIPEWKRILRENGRILIWWIPWWHPYSAHIESLVAIPWAHAVFSDKVLTETCRRIYDMPDFRPRTWDLDVNGNKKPNKWNKIVTLPEVNRLTMRRFEEICAAIGLPIERRTLNGFGSSWVAKLTHLFLYIPIVREFFTSSVIYSLKKPSRDSINAIL